MKPEDFHASYAGTPPWDIGRPQPALEAVPLAGRVLDVGCGTGEHALMAAARGFEAVGVDTAAAAIELARGKARERGLAVEFVVGDALDLSPLGGFGTVLDMGVFHVFDDADRARYVASLAAATALGGRLFVLCFSERLAGVSAGPRRISEAELRSAFADGWRVDAIEPSAIVTTSAPDGLPAWLASFTRG